MQFQYPVGDDLTACTGCGACAAACPTNAIELLPDIEGFHVPYINKELCVDCDSCEKTCPIADATYDQTNINSNKSENFPLIYASWSKNNDIRYKSSSGGIFSSLGEKILEYDGIVIGASFNPDLEVQHKAVHLRDDILQLRGSKYVQSYISKDLYQQIKTRLKQGQLILFSGTPCQVSGLRSFLNRDYSNLYCCDIICHGVPSPFFFNKYITEESNKHGKIKDVNFREKSNGWKYFNIRKTFDKNKSVVRSVFTDPYMLAFLRNYSLRNSCYQCKFTKTHRVGDITLGDFWGVEKNYPNYNIDDKGTSLILINNEKGAHMLDMCKNDLFIGEADLDSALTKNPMLTCPAKYPKERLQFYRDLKQLTFKSFITKYNLKGPSLYKRAYKLFKNKVKSVLVSLKIYK